MQELERYKTVVEEIKDKGKIVFTRPAVFVSKFVNNNILKLDDSEYGEFKYGNDNINHHICATYFTLNDSGKPILKLFQKQDFENMQYPIAIIFNNSKIKQLCGSSSNLGDFKKNDDVEFLTKKEAKRRKKNENTRIGLNSSVLDELSTTKDDVSDESDSENSFCLLQDDEEEEEKEYLLINSRRIGHNLGYTYGNGSNDIDDTFLNNAKKDYNNRYEKNGNQKIDDFNEFQIQPKDWKDINGMKIDGLFIDFADYPKKDQIVTDASMMINKVEKYILVLTDDGFRVIDKENFIEKNQKNLESFFLTIDEAIKKEQREAKITNLTTALNNAQLRMNGEAKKESFSVLEEKANNVVKKISEGDIYKITNRKGNHSFFSRANLKNKQQGSVVRYNKKTFQHIKQK